MKKTLSTLMAILLIVMAVPFSAVTFAEGEAIVINESGAYTVGSCESLTIDGAEATITLQNAVINGNGRSAIILQNGADVKLVLEGTSTIKGDENTPSAGILVDEFSSLVIEGTGTLDVTGGKYGAAIGSFGTDINIPYEQRRNVGTITINSGNIIAHGGKRGAGIGSGYHVNGNYIEINGGTIYAYGNECGAGIGSGYGTSGGAIGVAAVGEYDAGKININGGTIYAAAFDIDFSTVDYLHPENITDANTFAAGIGGGYGASASEIDIEGGTIVAIGSCGGAGIGSGRGTSKAAKYNADAFAVNIKIAGSSNVTAIALDDNRNHNGGGAAIGSGRGTHTGGTIEITDLANVKAIAASNACAIGVGAEKNPVDGTIPVTDSIVITEAVKLYAVSLGRVAVDKDAKNFAVAETIGHNDEIAASEVPSTVTLSIIDYTVPANSLSLWANITDKTSAEPEVTDEPVAGPTIDLGFVCPRRMAVRFEDGSVYYGGESIPVEIGKEYRFQMCSVDWDTNTYTDDGHGLAGTVVYTVKVSNSYAERSWDPETKTLVLPKGDPVLRTDVNKCFMAYRYHFEKQYAHEYNRQTGINQVLLLKASQ